MGVSFPAIQGGRDLRPPLRAPIWRLIPRKYRQVSAPHPPPPTFLEPSNLFVSITPSVPPSWPSSPRRQKSPVNSKHLYGQGPIRELPFPEPAQMKFYSLHEKNCRGRRGEKTDNKVKQTLGGRSRRRGDEGWWAGHQICFPVCLIKRELGFLCQRNNNTAADAFFSSFSERLTDPQEGQRS